MQASHYFEGEQETYKGVQPLFEGDENVICLENWQQKRDGEKRLLAKRTITASGSSRYITSASTRSFNVYTTAANIPEPASASHSARKLSKFMACTSAWNPRQAGLQVLFHHSVWEMIP